MKSKFELSELSAIEFKSYRAKLYKELARMKAEHADASNPTSFLLVSEFQYSDLAGKKIPFLVVGSLKPEWKKYFKSDIKTRKNRDWAVGKCSFGASGELNFEVNAGKITNTWINIIDKLLLNPAKLSANVVEKLVGDGENVELDADDEATAPAQEAAAPATPAAPKAAKPTKNKKEAYQELFVAAAAPLSDMVADVQAKFPTVEKDILPKLKSAQSLNDLDKNDKKAINDINTLCTKFEEAYKAAKKQVQKEFAKAYQQINDIKKQLSPASKPLIAEKVKERVNQFYEVAKQCADKFYAKVKKTVAPKQAVDTMYVNILKAQKASAANKEVAIPTSAICLAAAQRGPNFKLEDAALIAEKMRRPA